LAGNARRSHHESLTDALIARGAINIQVHDVHVACGAIRIVTEVIQQIANYLALVFRHQARNGRLSSKAIALISVSGQLEVGQIAQLAKVASKLPGKIAD